MHFTCPGKAARATIASLTLAAAALWAFIGIRHGRTGPEEFELAGWAAVTVTLSLVLIIVGVILRDGIRDSLVGAVTATRPGAAAAPLHLVKTEEDAG
jgi:hypothetical protein